MPSSSVMLRYLVSNAPLAWLTDSDIRRTSLLSPIRRPLLRFGDGSAIEKSLRRSRNSNLRTLCKSGPLELIQAACPAEGAALLDTFVGWYDFRQAGVHGATPFLDDPNKRPFYRAMMDVPGLLHVSSLRAGEHVTSIHFGVRQRREMTLGAMAYNPLFGKQSPGKLHVQILARAERQQGYEQLDLTPGGDAYKQRHATDWDTVHELSLFPGASRRRRAVFGAIVKQAGQRMLASLQVSPNQARSIAETVRTFRPIAASAQCVRRGARWLAPGGEILLYSLARADFRESGPTEPGAMVRRDTFQDFLADRGARAGGSRRRFVQAALERFEHGQHSYTCVYNGRLLHVAWLIERHGEAMPVATLGGWLLPKHRALVTDVFNVAANATDPAAGCLEAMAKDAFAVAGTEAIIVAVPENAAAARRLVEGMGFVYQESLCNEAQLGRVRRWTRQPPTAPFAPPQPRIVPLRYEVAKEV
jgi:hypothetical protein